MIEQLHWGWYFIGLWIMPRTTFLIFLIYHCNFVPIWFQMIGWIFALGLDIEWKINTKGD